MMPEPIYDKQTGQCLNYQPSEDSISVDFTEEEVLAMLFDDVDDEIREMCR